MYRLSSWPQRSIEHIYGFKFRTTRARRRLLPLGGLEEDADAFHLVVLTVVNNLEQAQVVEVGGQAG